MFNYCYTFVVLRERRDTTGGLLVSGHFRIAQGLLSLVA
ncbi:hypothetical protein ANTHELSMS3_01270 [Antarctobacter heliothermus]|uniref:Uncharacterized protein n=1 Tax=Antarctobacter heliothermus TaxID=74033 RepID=A0A222E1Z4_9RHOB|nr:hypothetical protein ANTHELSMS3_01270 [Antarctobacter heliothermus]